MIIEFTKRARERARVVDTYWRRQRPAAPDLFIDELDDAVVRLADGTATGVLHRKRPRSDIYGLLLPDSQQVIDYAVLPAREIIRILTVWGARRRPGPRL